MNTRLYVPKRSFLMFLISVAFLMVLMGGIDKAEPCSAYVVGTCTSSPNCFQQDYTCYFGYNTIQSAVDASWMNDYDVAIVCPGTYIENVRIYGFSRVYSYSGNPSDTIVVADDPDKPVFDITGDAYIPGGFTLRGATGSCTGYPGGGNCAGLLVDNTSLDISGFLIYDNAYGIKLVDSTGSGIVNNLIYDNDNGIQLINSSGTVIYHNNIINNDIQADDDNPANNDWHHPTLLEGNYWSDYTGLDDGSGTGKHAIAGDGIGDTNIPHPGPDYDYYPYMFSYGWLCSNLPVAIGGTGYYKIQEAYDDADNGETIQSRAIYFPENLNINRPSISVTLEGGYDCDYIDNTGTTRLIGDMTVTYGSLTIGNFILED